MKSLQNYPNVSRFKVQLYLNYLADFISTQPKKLVSSNCQAKRRSEKCIKDKVDKKGDWECYILLPEREECLYILKTKTTSSHKVIYFKRNKLYKIWLCKFFPVLVENIEFK